jgi:hypothetical protein
MCLNTMESGGWALFRRVAQGTVWHSAQDGLTGKASYGVTNAKPTDGTTLSIPFGHLLGASTMFMFTTGAVTDLLRRCFLDSCASLHSFIRICAAVFSTRVLSYLHLYVFVQLCSRLVCFLTFIHTYSCSCVLDSCAFLLTFIHTHLCSCFLDLCVAYFCSCSCPRVIDFCHQVTCPSG